MGIKDFVDGIKKLALFINEEGEVKGIKTIEEVEEEEYDPTPYCNWCGAGPKKTSCECPTRAEND